MHSNRVPNSSKTGKASYDAMIPEELQSTTRQLESRRNFLGSGGNLLARTALASLLGGNACGVRPSLAGTTSEQTGGILNGPHFKPTAKRVIYLFMSGAPPQMDLWDYKPGLQEWFDRDLPESIRGTVMPTGMTAGQSRFPVAPSHWGFQQHGQLGKWVSELLPHTAKLVDDLTVVHSMHTDAINHEPAILMMNTGNMIPGKPSLGAWLSYGLGSVNQNLPAFVVLNSKFTVGNGQPINSRLWGSGFLSTRHAGIMLRAAQDPVLYLKNPPGMSRSVRRTMLDAVSQLNEKTYRETADPETHARISQYEMAFRMQTSVPDLVDFSDESQSTWDLYGEAAKQPGSFANNCLMARRLAERGVPFTQIYKRGWDLHGDCVGTLPKLCAETDRPAYALVTDLRRRGLLDDTLVLWGGEFGRTVYSQGGLSRENYGRDHHAKCFSLWMAGGGVQAGMSYGKTDEFSFSITENPVHIRDLNATILHCLGIDHNRLTFKLQGLEQKLTGVEEAHVVQAILQRASIS
ncbi:DUF1501 domain-containing protein [Aureliella helgolandensis]|uniref:Sulfatase n=1 Tax=Aureliella helgolandensis TaxID=2527968 RepID=A0A518GG30_9BACT|nr:DUF1501 domain-containing protein [Aureliella helgolandensis]QDV27554.1 hypothetical protein Q31a_59430 [Aureliella helgolandensis]